MDSGDFWQGILVANQDNDTGQVPVGRVRSINLTITNLGVQAARVKLAVSADVSTANQYRIEPDLDLPAGGLYRLTGEVVGAGKRVVVWTSQPDVAARISGFEEDV